MVLAYQETGAPTWEWLLLLGAIAVYRALPDGRLRQAVNGLRWLTFFILLLLILGFAAGQLRQALFPVLENPVASLSTGQNNAPPREAAIAIPAPATKAESVPAEAMDKVGAGRASSALETASVSHHQARAATNSPPTLRRVDPEARVQTGPGLPDWRWRSHQLRWEGPVSQTQTLDLWLLSPTDNQALTLLRLLLLAALLCGATGWRGGKGGFALTQIRRLAAPAGAATLLVVLLAGGL